MSDADDLALVKRVYAAAGEGRWADVRADMADDFNIVEAAGLPYAGTYTGPDALEKLLAIVSGYWTGFRLEFKGITVGDGMVIAEVIFNGASKRTGEAFAMPLLEQWRVRDGKIAEIRPFYFDTALLARIA